MKLRKTTKRWISMALTLLMMITSVFTGDYAIFAADSEEYTYADGFPCWKAKPSPERSF